MDKHPSLQRFKRVGTGLCFIIFPSVFVFAFSVHPGLLHPRLLRPEELILRAHHADLLQFAHVLVTLNTALLVVIAVHFMKLLERTSCAWAGLAGAAGGILGAVILAADKGALCLTMTALDTVPASQFALMMPGVLSMFSLRGWMVLLWGILLLPLGFAIMTIALLRTRALPRWQSALFLTGVLLVGFPDGAEIVNLTASILMAAALIPYGILMLGPHNSVGIAATPARESLWTQEARNGAGAEVRSLQRQACRTCRHKQRAGQERVAAAIS
jgi:hypothetical protein